MELRATIIYTEFGPHNTVSFRPLFCVRVYVTASHIFLSHEKKAVIWSSPSCQKWANGSSSACMHTFERAVASGQLAPIPTKILTLQCPLPIPRTQFAK